jgi:hypothetical protein
MTAVLDACSDGLDTRSGKLELRVDDSVFCRSCQIGLQVSGTQVFTDYSQVGPDGKVIQIPDVLSEDFNTVGEGCLGPGQLNKKSILDGTLHLIGPQTDTSFIFSRLTLETESVIFLRQFCRTIMRQSGNIQVEDAVNDRRFSHESKGLVTTETPLGNGTRATTIDTLRDGSFQVDCLGGEVQLTTLEAFAFSEDAECATAGRMEVAFGGGQSVSQIVATETGGLAFDFDSDGEIDEEVSDCNAPSLSQCRVELPALRPPAEPVPTGKIVVANDERILTNLGFATAPDTVTFVDNLTAWFTDGQAGRFHAYSTNLGLLQSSLAEVVAESGHTWTTGTDLPFDIATLAAFDGIFSALDAPGLDLDVLSTYVRGGGNVYIAAGTSQNASGTADFWRPFLQRFGLDLEGQIGIRSGNVPITSSHPIFNGVSALYPDGGQGVVAIDSRAEIIAVSGDIGLFGVFR